MEDLDEKVITVAMEIILSAGDARTHATQGMKAELSGNRAEADQCIKDAKECIKDAHNAQTGMIQDEARGNKADFSLLLIHAQDTVMTIISEVNMIELMIHMHRQLEDKINGDR